MAIQIRRGTNTEWESNNSNIVVGEPAIATDAERFFVGTASGDFAEFANLDIIAPAYDTTTSYVVGDIINYHGKLYSCNAPCSGAFNIGYWNETSLTEILKDLENEITYAQYEIGYANGKLITIDNGASEIPVKGLTLDIEAVQDLHGYDHPWVGGAGKNLYDDSQALLSGYLTSTGSVSGTGSASNKHSYKIPIVGGETYTYSVSLSYSSNERYCCFYDNTDTFISSVALLRNTTSVTFTAPSNAVSISLTIYNADGQKVQLEVGSTATAWTPYENICPISGWGEVNVTRTGKNLLGGDSLKDGVKYSISSATIDEDAKTITFSANATTTIGIGFASLSKLIFKENTRYTFIMTYNKLNTSVTSNMRIYYTDGTYDAIPSITSGQTKETVVLVSDANKTVYSLVKSNSSNSTVLYYDESGVFEGVLTADDFEPYKGQTYTTDLDVTRYGGTLDVTTGVLTVTHQYLEVSSCNSVATASTNVQYANIGLGSGNGANSDHSTNISSSYEQTESAPQTDGYFRLSGSTLYIYDNRFTDKATADAILASELPKVVYKLATPQVVQLTPTQVRTMLGTNNLWNDMNSNNELAYRISNALN